MKYLRTWTVPPSTLRDLAEHLRLTCSKLTLEQAVMLAISEWQANHGQQTGKELRGYQWKSLFLPDTTELRLIYGGNSYYARVVGDHILFRGRKVSPRELTMTVSNNVRNAWRELWIRFPGRRNWKSAHACRIEQQEIDKQPHMSPVDSMAAAAAAMSAALKTALMLVEQSSAQATQQMERRLAPLRRDDDRLHSDCSFD